MTTIGFKRIHKDASIPAQAYAGDAGWDLRTIEKVYLRPYSVTPIRTGLVLEIPLGYEVQLRGKSGLAKSEGLTIAQGIGTIDSNYRGEIIVLIHNTGGQMRILDQGAKVCQAVLAKLEPTEWKEITEEVSKTDRNEKGFGSSGK